MTTTTAGNEIWCNMQYLQPVACPPPDTSTMSHFSFGGAARHVVIRLLGHRGRTTMPRSAQVYLFCNLKSLRCISLDGVRLIFYCRKSNRQFCCGSCILYWPPALHMQFLYDTVNATLPRLVEVAMFFLEPDPAGRPIYPSLSGELAG